MKTILAYLINLVLIATIGCAAAWAQATAQISGTVKDQSGAVLPGVVVKTDYDTTPPSISLSSVAAAGSAMWDVALWDVSYWDAPTIPSVQWQSVSGMGRVGSVAMAFSTTSPVSVNGMDIVFEPGGYF